MGTPLGCARWVLVPDLAALGMQEVAEALLVKRPTGEGLPAGRSPGAHVDALDGNARKVDVSRCLRIGVPFLLVLLDGGADAQQLGHSLRGAALRVIHARDNAIKGAPL